MSKTWIPLRQLEGKASRQAHVRLPAGTYEREISKEGFFGPSAQFHHAHKPTDWIEFEGAIRPRAFDLGKLAGARPSPWDAQVVMTNPHMKMRMWRLEAAMPDLARNADGDELLFVHEGEGALFCDYGRLAYREGDYLVIPRGTMWRLEPTKPTACLMIEATNDSYRLPEKGLVGRHAIFDPAMLDTPALDEQFRAQQDERRWRVLVKRRGVVSTVTYPFNPLDAVGWHGDLSVVRINWRDLRPLMSHRFHLPPSAHTTFMASRFVVCTFVPRPLESDPEALKLPFFHSNDDYEEVLFYHKGSFFSRDNIHPGMMTLHPSGFTHGPHPKAFNAATKGGKTETDEVAVMIDTRDAVDVAPMPAGVEWEGYVHSWRPPELKQAAE
ncbi:MAG: homogentisate 1,2-dioxygenase [Alphaproteobacteria bacterium]|nr:homogentisate 1,2-dioxygenase [Alphaproteobacteria bacterium]